MRIEAWWSAGAAATTEHRRERVRTVSGRHRDEAAYGEYRTKRAILEMYDEMARAMAGGPPHPTRLEPSPADPRVAHPAHEAAAP